ncbi:hypothetical protein F5878DRAFT_601734 [Lentinula raphanica]|uniref:Secreted protein n=1 Tax=Lentinula raphanica TaxID=153919 RepID=A0AA38PKD1_9AGAR|nr:hypothetical protein F5878DRAFT_601734 [Lentinula raphanica]
MRHVVLLLIGGAERFWTVAWGNLCGMELPAFSCFHTWISDVHDRYGLYIATLIQGSTYYLPNVPQGWASHWTIGRGQLRRNFLLG